MSRDKVKTNSAADPLTSVSSIHLAQRFPDAGWLVLPLGSLLDMQGAEKSMCGRSLRNHFHTGAGHSGQHDSVSRDHGQSSVAQNNLFHIPFKPNGVSQQSLILASVPQGLGAEDYRKVGAKLAC